MLVLCYAFGRAYESVRTFANDRKVHSKALGDIEILTAKYQKAYSDATRKTELSQSEIAKRRTA
jgi:hypothetical protein